MESRRSLVSTGGFRTKPRSPAALSARTCFARFAAGAPCAHTISMDLLPLPKQKGRLLATFLFCLSLSKSIRRASFFEIEPWFSVGGQTYPLAMMGATLDRCLPGCCSMRVNGSMYCYGSKPKNVISKFSDI